MIVRLANLNDNQGLLELTHRTTMKGGLRLRIEHGPDFFEILRRRGDYNTFILEEKGKIIGSWSVVSHPVYIDGSITILHYFRDLKLHQEYQGTTVIFRISKALTDFQTGGNADIHLAIALKGNEKSISLLGGRAGLLKFEYTGSFTLKFCVLTAGKVNMDNYIFQTNPDFKELSDYYDKFYRNYQFGPVITTEHLQEYESIVLRRENRIVAAITLEDPIEYRRTVVVRYPLIFKGIIGIMRFLSILGVLAKPPSVKETIRILFIKYLACSDPRIGLSGLIRYSINYAYKQDYHFLCFGYHEKDPLKNCFKSFIGLKVKLLGYVASQKGSAATVKNIINGKLFEDHSLS